MYPELFRIGTFPVTSYGLWLAAGMLLALFAASRLGARDGIPRERIYDLGLWTLVGGLVGSKLLMLMIEDNVNVLSLDFLRSGGVFYGGHVNPLDVFGKSVRSFTETIELVFTSNEHAFVWSRLLVSAKRVLHCILG